MYRAIDTVLKSFARTAALGIADRVLLVDQGDLLEMIETSRGMVVVNATSGTLALARDKPVKALGDPVYDMAGLTDVQPLDAFWGTPQAPAAGLYDAFCYVLVHCCLIHGAFLGNVGVELLVAESALRLVAPDSVDAEFG